MAYKEPEEPISGMYEPPVKNRLSEAELQQLDREIEEKYMVEKEIDFPQKDTIRVFDWNRFMYEKGAINKDGAVFIKNHIPGEYNSRGQLVKPQDCSPIRYEQVNADIEHWREWKGRRSFGKQKQMEGYEQLAAQMGM